MRTPSVLRMFKATVAAWQRDNVPRLGAALSYYTLFAIAPVLIVVIAVAGMVWGAEAVTGQIVGQLDQLIGQDGAKLVQDMLAAASRPRDSIVATVLGSLAFLLAVSGAFLELQAALNKIWRVKPKPGTSGLHILLINRLRSFGLVVAIGFVLMVSLAVSAALSAVGTMLDPSSALLRFTWNSINVVMSFLIIALMFAILYRVLPDVKLGWRDVGTGALVTALLFTIGKTLIGLYIGRSSVASTYGAAGSVAVLLLWVYYSSQIVLLGAEFTRVATRTRRGAARPETYAKKTAPRQDAEPEVTPKTGRNEGNEGNGKGEGEKGRRQRPQREKAVNAAVSFKKAAKAGVALLALGVTAYTRRKALSDWDGNARKQVRRRLAEVRARQR